MQSLKLPSPPDTYDPEYMRRLVNSLTLWSQQFQYAVTIKVRFMDGAEIPLVSSLSTLPSGSVYNDANVLKVKP